MAIKENTFYDGGPHIGDLIVNILLGFTVICLPLTVAAIVRSLWLRYLITDRRVSVTSGWMGRERTDIIYKDITKIAKMPRGIGLWGDIVITLNNRTRLELRAIPNFREVSEYIAEKVAQKTAKSKEAITAM